jgi:hypothetical protein
VCRVDRKGTDILEFRHKPSGVDVPLRLWGVKNPQTYVHDSTAAAAPFMDFIRADGRNCFQMQEQLHVQSAELGSQEICNSAWEFCCIGNSAQHVA